MPHALLLSPDDQAVSAITGVLEEMSVTCERPLDGVSAAQKLNAQSFDLVLVDCENLPAAKLIFDVCRRGKNGTSPVPIAIVDGRAGLPTAFRLGAELILTKPVARDQARSTIRTAVSRLRKEETPRAAEAEETSPIAAATPAQPEKLAMAAAATASPQPTKSFETSETAKIGVPSAPAVSTTVEKIAPTSVTSSPEPASPAKLSKSEGPLVSKPVSHKQISDDPILAELERDEAGPPPPPVVSSHQPNRAKSGRAMALTVLLALAGGGLYAAWMYQPGFRTVLQPQIDRVLALVGVAPQHQTARPIPAPAPAQPAVQRPAVPVALPAAPTGSEQPSAGAAAGSPDASPPASAVEAKSTLATPDPEPRISKTELVDAKKTAAAVDSVSADKTSAVILSSKGAEKRLIRHIPPALPKGATAQELDGTIVLKTLVDASGKVASVQVVEGNPAVADAAIHAVKQWRYRPYVRDGKTLPFQTIVLVDFQRP